MITTTIVLGTSSMTHVLAATDDGGGSSRTMIEKEEKNGSVVPTAPTSYIRSKIRTNVDNSNSNVAVAKGNTIVTLVCITLMIKKIGVDHVYVKRGFFQDWQYFTKQS